MRYTQDPVTLEINVMTDENTQSQPTAGADATGTSIAALEERVAELEAIVHQIVPAVRDVPHHNGISAWLEKVGARLEAAVKKL